MTIKLFNIAIGYKISLSLYFMLFLVIDWLYIFKNSFKFLSNTL